MIKYINMKDSNGVETVDEFPWNSREERDEARRCLGEYRLASGWNAEFYFSQRATKEWSER